MDDMPYRYLISWTGTQKGQQMWGHSSLHRKTPFTSDKFDEVVEFLRDENELDRRPAIVGVFTYADTPSGAQDEE